MENKKVTVEGDIIAIHGNEKSHFRLAIALDDKRAVLIFDLSTGIIEHIFNLITKITKEKIELQTLNLPGEFPLEDLLEESFEIYKINIYSTPTLFEKETSDFFAIFKANLIQFQQLIVGDIVKMNGLKVMNTFVLYHHHAIFTDPKKFKVIHKWGELNKYEILKNVMGDSFENVTVREDNLLEVAAFREISVCNSYDEKYRDQIKLTEEILKSAQERIGETGYDIMTDNCQHFCTDCRYGVPVAIEIENTKAVVAATAVGVSFLVGAIGAYAASRKAKKEESPRK